MSSVLDYLRRGENFIVTHESTRPCSRASVLAYALVSLIAVRSVFDLEIKGLSGLKLLERIASPTTINEVIRLSPLWVHEMQPKVEDVLSLPLSQSSFGVVTTKYDHIRLDDFLELLGKLCGNIDDRQCTAAIVSRTYDAIALLCVPAADPSLPTAFVLLDFHPRRNHPGGPALVCFPTAGATAQYLAYLFSDDDSLGLDHQRQPEPLTHYSAHVLTRRGVWKPPRLDMRATYSADFRLLEVRTRARHAGAARANRARGISQLRADGPCLLERKTAMESAEPRPKSTTADGTEQLDVLMRQKGWKHCPGCETPTEKTWGCNHMTCKGCTCHWCYQCGKTMYTLGERRHQCS